MPEFHRKLERSAIGFVLAIIGVASIGGFVEIAPLFTIDETVEDAPDMRVYTPLELAGRNIYIREGCYACHSQMIRTLRDEVERYGPYSLAVESKYDHPMLWGSKRTGPDLARVGEQIFRCLACRPSHQSARCRAGIGDAELWLAAAQSAAGSTISASISRRMRTVGVPYTDEMIANATNDAFGQATPDSDIAAGVTERYGEATQVRAFDGDPSHAHRDGCARRLSADPRPADRCRASADGLGGGVGRWTSTTIPSSASPRAGACST